MTHPATTFTTRTRHAPVMQSPYSTRAVTRKIDDRLVYRKRLSIGRALTLAPDRSAVAMCFYYPNVCAATCARRRLGALREQHAFERKFSRGVLVPGPNAFAVGYTKPLRQIQVSIADLLHVSMVALAAVLERHDTTSTASRTSGSIVCWRSFRIARPMRSSWRSSADRKSTAGSPREARPTVSATYAARRLPSTHGWILRMAV